MMGAGAFLPLLAETAAQDDIQFRSGFMDGVLNDVGDIGVFLHIEHMNAIASAQDDIAGGFFLFMTDGDMLVQGGAKLGDDGI